MRFKVQYDVGLTQLERLNAYGLRKAVRIAVNRAAAKIKATVVSKANAVRRYGFLGRSIRIRVKVYRQLCHVAIIGTTRGFKRTKGKFTRGPKKGQKRVIVPSRYAHLVERGTKWTKAKPFIKPAEAESVPRFREDVKREIAKEIQLELARQAAR